MSSSQAPGSTAIAAEATALWSRRRRRLTWQNAAPYLLVTPVVAAIGLILGYPLVNLIRISLEKYGLFELIRHSGEWVGLRNYGSVLHDSIFWNTLARTAVFTVANVGLTMVVGTLLALLLVRTSPFMRVVLSAGLVLVWSMPVVVAIQIWYWMTNHQNGVVNFVFTKLQFGDYEQHDWYATPFSQLSLVTTLIVWGAIPFVTISVYAALAQVPDELVEAAEVDGARPWRVFLDVTLPVLKPILLILTSLSIIWDFGVFTQPYLLIAPEHINTSNYLMGVYLYQEAYVNRDYGRGATISVLMLFAVAVMSIFYVRKMVRMGDVR
jgi:N,N'-diacetylchitobiose transport system permease protein